MDAHPERSRPLHNFELPDHLKWNNKRLSQCMKVSNRRSLAPETQSRGVNRKRQGNEMINRRSVNANQSLMISPSKLIGCYSVRSANSDQDRNKDGIEAVREKLMLDLRVAADRMKVSMLDNSNSTKPWNLRTRRAACTVPKVAGAKNPVSCNSSVPVAAISSSKQKERARFSISLRRDEIERDLMVMTGLKPPRRPKKRPRAVQRHLDTLVPGAWLTEITPEIYKVLHISEPAGKA